MSEFRDSAMLPQEVVQAFTEATLTTLRELTQIEACAEQTPQNLRFSSGVPLVSARLVLMRPVPGEMSLVVTLETASLLAARYLPEGTALTAEIIDDVLGEFANVIAGQAKTMLKGTPHHFTMSLPAVIRVQDFDQLSCLTSTVPTAALESELGIFLQFVSLP